MDLDDLQRQNDGVSRYQILSVLAISLATVPLAPVWATGAFLSAVPDHRCKFWFDENENALNVLNEAIIAKLVDNSCHRYNYNYSACVNMSITCLAAQGQVDSIPCDNGYYYQDEYFNKTTVSEWNLVCDRKTLDSLANSLFFAGFFIGSAVSGMVSDWYGRKKAFLVFLSLLIATNIAITFAPWFELYLVLRTIAGSVLIAAYLVSFTLATELVPTAYRTHASTFLSIFNTSTGMLLTLFASQLRDWRQWHLVMSTFGIPFLLLFYVIPESPRWLLLNKRPDDAKQIMKKCFKGKNQVLEDDTWNKVVQTEQKKVEEGHEKDKLSYIDLLRFPMTRIVSCNVMFCWFTASMVSYGLILNVTKLAGNPYVNDVLNVLMSLAGYVVVFASKKLGRRMVQSAGFFGAEVSCVLSMVLNLTAKNNQAQISASVTMAFVGKFFVAFTFLTVYIVTVETFPTCLRSTGLGIGSMGARISGMIIPFTLQLNYEVPWLTQTIFGVLSVVAGITTLGFPETNTIDYIATLHEAKDFYRLNMPTTVKIFRIRGSQKQQRLE